MSRETLEEEQQRLLGVIHLMKLFTSNSLSPIFGSITETEGELVGSGTIVQLRGRPYLLTAQHVAKYLTARTTTGELLYPAGLCHFAGEDEQMLRTGPRWYAWPRPQDIAVSAIDQSAYAKTSLSHIPASKFAKNTRTLSDDLYFVHGWPGMYSRTLPLARPGIFSRSLAYGGWLTTEVTWSGFNNDMHIAVTYPMVDIIDERERVANLPLPGGMSGSLLWKTNYLGAEARWVPGMAEVVGLVHRFDETSQCLIATRIEYVKGLCLLVLREEHAYRRWDERGRPQGDDWADWFAAESEVTTL